ncbi:anaphase-promoting complex subunit 2 [Neolamprologus brichardi]|uniref:anaphase-promoting complex subunit 2 n=1 Tax=Neolamprologus brichardi TaxID=32507 RepID=UPI00164390C5|nr:anaphase-promoting complex subunit 2 [Neolamprologus brichardi]
MEESAMEPDSVEMSGSGPNPGVAESWETVTAALVSPGISVSEQSLSDSLALLNDQGLGRLLGSWLLETLQMRLSACVVPEFWSGLKQPENEMEEKDRVWVLLTAFRTLLDRLEPFLAGLEKLGAWQDEGRGGLCGPGSKALKERAFTTIRALLLFSPAPVLQERVLEFYSRTFSVYMNREGSGEDATEAPDGPDGGACRGCWVPVQQCWCQQALEHLQELSHILSKLQLLEWVSSEAVTTILHKLIEMRMEQLCRGEYERSFLLEFQEWLELVLGWLAKVFASEADGDAASLPAAPGGLGVQVVPSGGSVLKQWRCHMHQFFCRIYVNMRIEELFSIIRDFPESKAAIEDLKFCLERTNQRQQLLTSLKSAFESRLLHPGVHTSDILTVYISAIKALRELDPSMVILQVVSQPIRKYLRTREDTVRQIVAGLTGDAEGCTDLASELSRGDPVTLEMQDSDEEGNDPEDWTPDPTDAMPDKMGSKRRSSDIISLLVSIYGSKEIFIDEYRGVLADRLLQQLNYNTAREIRNVELLKLRFGESHMHYCEVMLKDMADSRRINSNIREEESKLSEEEQPPLPLSAIILLFWVYVQAMLTNLDTMTLERIHTMLRMFVATGPVVTEMDVNELEAFLQRKVRDHQLIMSGNVYRLPKSN